MIEQCESEKIAFSRGRIWFAKPIANTAHALNPSCTANRFNFLANALNTYIYHIRIRIKIITPDMFEDLRAGEYPTGRSHQIFQEIKFSTCKFYRMAIASNFSQNAIELNWANAQNILPTPGSTPHHSINPSH